MSIIQDRSFKAINRITGGAGARSYVAGILCLLLLLFASCELPPRQQQGDYFNPTSPAGQPADTAGSEEEYVMITAAVNLPLYVNHEQAAFKKWGQRMGVKTAILGNEEWDVQKTVEIIEEMIQQHPGGLLINGTDPGLATSINKAVAAGIPVVVYDSEIPGSQPNCFIGSDWYSMGYKQGARLALLTGGKGKVACMGLLGEKNQEDGMRGFQEALNEHPGMQFIGKYNDAANVENAARQSSDLIAAHPDLAAISGFTSASGPGIALAVREAGKAGKIQITCVDFEPEHLALIREGLIQYTVGQKRELFAAYGAEFLYNMQHGKFAFSENDRQAGVNPMPVHVNTGLIEIDRSNIRYFSK